MSKTSADHQLFHQQDERPDPARVRSVRVMQICTALRGGAAKAAHRLHRAFAKEEVKSQMLVAQQCSAGEDTLEYNPVKPVPAVVGRAFFRLSRRWNHARFRKAGAYFTPDWTLNGWRLPSLLPPCDLVNLHWVADFLDYHTLPQLTTQVPVVWTFHDMNTFTGGCHYSGTCERYTARCGACPQLKTSSGENDVTRRILNRKQRIFERISPDRFTIVCPSRWLAREAQRSTLCQRFETHIIPNGVDPLDYYPVERMAARRRFNLPAGARIILFVAEQITDLRKGFRFLLKAIDAIRAIPGLLLVTLGRGDTSFLTGPLFRHLGQINDIESMRSAYSAADVFAIPSLQDNLPNTILESMACGTPVAGFDAGGVGEAVIDGQTGLLAATGDADAFAINLRSILEDQLLQWTLGRESLARVGREFSVSLQARRYTALYQEILQTRPANGWHAQQSISTAC